MQLPLLFLVLFIASSSKQSLPSSPLPDAHTVRSRRVRSLWNLERVSECELGYSAIHYDGYGCWCGPGGSGTPIDEIDSCCMHHDKCYDKAVDDALCFDTAMEYVEPYDWDCVNKTAICTSNPNPPNCHAALCACDVAVVNCWKQYPRPLQKLKCNQVERAFGSFDRAVKKARERGFYH